MPSLRSHSKDPAIGMTGQANLELIADVLALEARRAVHPFLKWLSPFRAQAQTLALLAAVFARVRGTPEETPSQLDARVRIAMGEPRCE